MIFRTAYKILGFFNLQFALFVLAAGALLYLTGLFERSHAALMIFYAALIISVFAGVFATLKKLFSAGNIKKGNGVQIVKKVNACTEKGGNTIGAELGADRGTEDNAGHHEPYGGTCVRAASGGAGSSENLYEGGYGGETHVSEKPGVYAVKGHPRYFMTEYADRYELFYLGAEGLEKIRTDYK